MMSNAYLELKLEEARKRRQERKNRGVIEPPQQILSEIQDLKSNEITVIKEEENKLQDEKYEIEREMDIISGAEVIAETRGSVFPVMSTKEGVEKSIVSTGRVKQNNEEELEDLYIQKQNLIEDSVLNSREVTGNRITEDYKREREELYSQNRSSSLGYESKVNHPYVTKDENKNMNMLVKIGIVIIILLLLLLFLLGFSIFLNRNKASVESGNTVMNVSSNVNPKNKDLVNLNGYMYRNDSSVVSSYRLFTTKWLDRLYIDNLDFYSNSEINSAYSEYCRLVREIEKVDQGIMPGTNKRFEEVTYAEVDDAYRSHLTEISQIR